MQIQDGFGFYGIINNPVRGYEYLTKLFVDHEIRFIQLRMKKETLREVYKAAEKLRKITDGTRSLLIINDYVQVARDIYADGAHVGQEDLAFEEAERLLGPDRVIGLSTNEPERLAKDGRPLPAYIGVGPVFKTPLKVTVEPELGLDGLRKALDASSVPVVAIGAIDAGNLAEVLRAGVRNFASIRPLNDTPQPEKALKELLKICRSETSGRYDSSPVLK